MDKNETLNNNREHNFVDVLPSIVTLSITFNNPLLSFYFDESIWLRNLVFDMNGSVRLIIFIVLYLLSLFLNPKPLAYIIPLCYGRRGKNMEILPPILNLC